MDNKNKPKTLPEKVMRRHLEFIEDLIPDFTQLVLEKGRPADLLLSRHLKNHKELGSRDRRFLSQALFSYFRWYGWTVRKLELRPAQACLIGTALDCEELAPSFIYMAERSKLPFRVEAVGGKSTVEKLEIMNDWFQNFPTYEAPLTLEDLAFPDFNSVIEDEAARRCLEVFQERPPTWIRSRADSGNIVKLLDQADIAFDQHDHLTNAIRVPGGTNLNGVLSEISAQYIVQDIASQTVAHIAAPEKGSDWWDCCSGSGGKSLHMMDLMQGEGKILATDIRIPVLKELKKRTRASGIKNIRMQPHDMVKDEPFTKVFDGVLVDAPCSGWGTWGRNPDARWRTTRRDVIQNSNRQQKILEKASCCVKQGGTLIYAVCSLTEPETLAVVKKFLEDHSEFTLEPFANPLTGEMTDGTLQVWPWEGPGDGMFSARFKRAAE